MLHRFVVGTFALALCVTEMAVTPAYADEDVRRMVREELQATLEKQKTEDTKDRVFRARWNNGVVFETPDKAYALRIGGRIHLDTNLIKADDGLEGAAPGLGDDFDDATFFRRVRLCLMGDITKHVDYEISVDFAEADTPVLRNAYVTLKGLKDCVGCWAPQVRVGQHYEPIGLETLTSDNYTTFIERAGMTCLHPERSIGASLIDSFWNDRGTAQLGFFSPDGDDEENGFALWDEEEGDGGTALTGRFTCVPWARDTCRFLHLGVSGSWRRSDEVRYRARPGLGRGPRIVDTGALADPGDVWLVGTEAALVWGPWHVASEWTSLALDDPARGDPTFDAWYVQAGWFLTGESKAFAYRQGVWGSVKPCRAFLAEGCCLGGALELAARYDWLDLTDGSVFGGELETWTVGLNWYLNPHARLMFDLTHARAQDRASSGTVITGANVTAFLMRLDVHF